MEIITTTWKWDNG